MADSDSPYVGLAPYVAADAPFFFGREDEAEMVAANLMSRPLIVLFGQSGVGKTSLLNAGLTYALRRLEDASGDDPQHAALAICSSWRDDAVEAIRDSVHTAVPELERRSTAPDLPDVARGAVEHRRELFLVLDQFEEYFLYHTIDEDRELATQLKRVLAARELPVSVLISLRDDALAKLDRLKEIPRLFDNRLEIDHLTVEQARTAIMRPLEAYNARAADTRMEIESQLVDVIVDELRIGAVVAGPDRGGGADARVETAFLQLLLSRLWEVERVRDSRVLRLQTLEELGGAAHIVRTHIDGLLEALYPDDRTMAADLFRFLVTPSGNKISLTAADLAEFARYDVERVCGVLDRLASGGVRVLRVTPSQEGPQRYEIYHDILAASLLDWSTRQRRLDESQRLIYDAESERRRARRARTMLLALVIALLTIVVLLILLLVQAQHGAG